MFHGLVSGAVTVPGFRFLHELSDIETLNQRALRGELEVTAVSVHAYAYLSEHYQIMRSGASMGGQDYGPLLIAAPRFQLQKVSRPVIAIPGKYTSAALALQIYLDEQEIEAELKIVHFEKIISAVTAGEAHAGVIIHEGQLTHRRDGVEAIANLGAWWWQRTEGLPLPLGVNVVQRQLPADVKHAAQRALRGSIEYSLSNRAAALDYALSYGRGLESADADKFVGMYVNHYTVDMGADGEESISRFLREGHERGLIPRLVSPDIAE